MTTTINEKYLPEVLNRLKLLGVNEELITEIASSRTIPVTCISGVIDELGAIHKKALKYFSEIKSSAGCTPFYMIESFLGGYQLISILLFDNDDETWEYDHEMIAEENVHFAYVYNVDEPALSEFGYVALSIEDDALYRIG